MTNAEFYDEFTLLLKRFGVDKAVAILSGESKGLLTTGYRSDDNTLSGVKSPDDWMKDPTCYDKMDDLVKEMLNGEPSLPVHTDDQKSESEEISPENRNETLSQHPVE